MAGTKTAKKNEARHLDRRTIAEQRQARPMGMAANDDTLRQAQGRRTRHAVLVEGIGAPDMKMILPAEFNKLQIDERYQRLRVTPMVNLLIHVLRGGGEVFDPVTLCEREGAPGMLWIVDGQQRFWAHNDCTKPLRALVYQSTGWEAEAKLFEAMNDRVIVNANVMVKGHQGPCGELLRSYAKTVGTALYNNVDFGQGGRRPYGAFIVLKGMQACAAGVVPSGKALDACMRTDHALTTQAGAKTRATTFLDLFPIVFPATEVLHLLPMVAFARTLGRHLREGAKPTSSQLMKLRKVNWQAECDGHHSMKYLPVLEALIEKKWRQAGV